MERPLENLTLRELFTDTERMARELVEHLDQAFLPKVQQLAHLAQSGLEEGLPDEQLDRAVRNQAAQVLESDRFTAELSEAIGRYCSAIEQHVARIVAYETS